MNNQEILDNAPKGATHFIQQTLSVVYFKFGTHFIPLHWCNNKKGWRESQFFEFNNFRLLADISKIAELEQSRKDLIEEFAEAECMGDLAKIARNHGYEEQGE
tara:strand:+ start:5111 stop:5419 length:309 start_codon:yes stop_codon:yes gene_type:complete